MRPRRAQARLAVMDIGWAQELFGKAGRLSSLQLLLETQAAPKRSRRRSSSQLPPDLRAEPPRQRSFQLQNMLAAFQLNLSALSMVSLLVGVFLIYNTISASVTRRRARSASCARSGATRWEVRALFLGEACLFGVARNRARRGRRGALAQVLTGAVAQTISSLYVLLSIERALPDRRAVRAAAASSASARCSRAPGCRRTKRRASIPCAR